MTNSLWFLSVPCIAFAATPPAQAQESVETVRIELRVVSARIDSVVIDRGSVDGLAKGDRITFRTRDGKAYYGSVRRVEERGAQVDLDDPNFVPLPGTHGEALIPASRLANVQQQPPPVVPTVPEEPTTPEHPAWKPRADEWTQDQPLLARVRPLKPSERPRSIYGRIYAIADFTRSPEDNRTDGFYRAGTEVMIENARKSGERIHFDGELNYRNTDVPDNGDDSGTYLRVDRASYAVGGNRFQPSRLELGRFLHDNVPEFGVVDGVEWSRRLDSGDRVGLSAGFMPEPDPAMNTVQDFEFSASYRWVQDDTEQLSATAGVQATLHNSKSDRDLFVGKFQYLPRDGWSFTSTALVDYYTDGDANKGQGFEVTQAYVNSGKRWDDGSSVHVVYSHMAFPEMERDEFLPVTAAQLADDHNDRFALQSRVSISESWRVHGAAGVWVDENNDGSDHEFGIEVDNAFVSRSVIDVTGFDTDGKFVRAIGGRASFSRAMDSGRWGFEYELTGNRIDGFTDNNNDLAQHRVRLFLEHFTDSGWSLSGHIDGFVWDNENSLNVGFYVQKNF